VARFEVGDKVHKTGRFGQDKGFSVVAEVLKTRLILEDGSRYDLDGHTLGSGKLAGVLDRPTCETHRVYESKRCSNCNTQVGQ
jgi:hypothetical protein